MTEDSAVAETARAAAHAALVAEVGAEVVGEPVLLVMEGEGPEESGAEESGAEDSGGSGVATQYFECTQRGYPGWRWAVTVALPEGQGEPTVDEVVLLPGEESIVAPAWVPYRERIRPGDLSPGDILPTDEDDMRLVPAYLEGEEDLPQSEGQPMRTVAKELGLGRTRVLSIEGRRQAADRWLSGDQGPETPLAQNAPHRCWSCGFLVRIAGPLSETFGVCANEHANDDARVVSFGHGCGAHSEAQLRKKQLPVPVPDPTFDTLSPEDLETF